VSTSLLKAFELKLVSSSKAQLINQIAASAFCLAELAKIAIFGVFYYNLFISCFIG